jgi:hypothetical protein
MPASRHFSSITLRRSFLPDAPGVSRNIKGRASGSDCDAGDRGSNQLPPIVLKPIKAAVQARAKQTSSNRCKDNGDVGHNQDQARLSKPLCEITAYTQLRQLAGWSSLYFERLKVCSSSFRRGIFNF